MKSSKKLAKLNRKKDKENKIDKKRDKRLINDLFDNNMTRAALASMTPEQIQRYKNIGEEMYGTLDFESSKVLNNVPPPMREATAYLMDLVRSGLHPSMMSDNDKALLVESIGKDWYKRFGYVEQDLTEVVTVSGLQLY